MRRRDFLKSTFAAGLAAQIPGLIPTPIQMHTYQPLPKRYFKNEVSLSILGFGGIVVMGQSQKKASTMIAEAVDRGINYFDVAPAYGDGEAEEKLGPALEPYRQSIFLACKTMHRDVKGTRKELDRSLKRLRTDHFDLYQFHAVTTMDEVNQIFAQDGAVETFLKAREEGKIRFIGFSAHSEEAALAMMERFQFDSILFPVNFVCYAQGNFGPRVLQRAKEKGVARLALKPLAYSPWPKGAEHTYPKCWYKPIDDPALALQSLRFTLSEDVTAALPPGDENLFRLALETASSFTPMTAEERSVLLASTKGREPLFKI